MPRKLAESAQQRMSNVFNALVQSPNKHQTQNQNPNQNIPPTRHLESNVQYALENYSCDHQDQPSSQPINSFFLNFLSGGIGSPENLSDPENTDPLKQDDISPIAFPPPPIANTGYTTTSGQLNDIEFQKQVPPSEVDLSANNDSATITSSSSKPSQQSRSTDLPLNETMKPSQSKNNAKSDIPPKTNINTRLSSDSTNKPDNSDRSNIPDDPIQPVASPPRVLQHTSTSPVPESQLSPPLLRHLEKENNTRIKRQSKDPVTLVADDDPEQPVASSSTAHKHTSPSSLQKPTPPSPVPELQIIPDLLRDLKKKNITNIAFTPQLGKFVNIKTDNPPFSINHPKNSFFKGLTLNPSGTIDSDFSSKTLSHTINVGANASFTPEIPIHFGLEAGIQQKISTSYRFSYLAQFKSEVKIPDTSSQSIMKIIFGDQLVIPVHTTGITDDYKQKLKEWFKNNFTHFCFKELYGGYLFHHGVESEGNTIMNAVLGFLKNSVSLNNVISHKISKGNLQISGNVDIKKTHTETELIRDMVDKKNQIVVHLNQNYKTTYPVQQTYSPISSLLRDEEGTKYMTLLLDVIKDYLKTSGNYIKINSNHPECKKYVCVNSNTLRFSQDPNVNQQILLEQRNGQSINTHKFFFDLYSETVETEHDTRKKHYLTLDTDHKNIWGQRKLITSKTEPTLSSPAFVFFCGNSTRGPSTPGTIDGLLPLCISSASKERYQSILKLNNNENKIYLGYVLDPSTFSAWINQANAQIKPKIYFPTKPWKIRLKKNPVLRFSDSCSDLPLLLRGYWDFKPSDNHTHV